MKIDLHMHTTASDGEYSPAEIVKMVKQKGIEVFAITDHDTTAGVDEALAEANRQKIKLIPGIEFSAKDEEAKKVHILGYNLDYKNPDFIEIYKSYTDDRNRRNNEFIQKFNELGIEISLEDVKKYAKNVNIRKPEFAKVLVEKGYIKDEEEAYTKYLNQEPFKSIKRQKSEMSPREVIKIIHKFGGIAVLAHPYTLELEGEKLTNKIEEFISYGLEGMECFHSRQSKEQMKEYEKIANQHNLIITVGSDFHGPNVHPNIEIGTGKNNNIVDARVKYIEKIIGEQNV